VAVNCSIVWDGSCKGSVTKGATGLGDDTSPTVYGAQSSFTSDDSHQLHMRELPDRETDKQA